jgi:hypothetical protein
MSNEELIKDRTDVIYYKPKRERERERSMVAIKGEMSSEMNWI